MTQNQKPKCEDITGTRTPSPSSELVKAYIFFVITLFLLVLVFVTSGCVRVPIGSYEMVEVPCKHTNENEAWIAVRDEGASSVKSIEHMDIERHFIGDYYYTFGFKKSKTVEDARAGR